LTAKTGIQQSLDDRISKFVDACLVIHTSPFVCHRY
jgi:hypothetical protein